MFDWLGNVFKSGERGQIAARIEPTFGNSIDYVDVPSSDAVKMGLIFQEFQTSAGAVVNEKTAMRVSAVYACSRLISGAMASLPLRCYKRGDKGLEEVPDHPYVELFNEQPTPRFTAATFWEFVTLQQMFRGDGIAYIVRPNAYSPVISGVIPVPRTNVVIRRRGDRLYYIIQDIDPDSGESKYFTADQDDVLHFPGFGFNGKESLSVIQWAARQAIGTAIKADEFAGTFFSNGAHVQYAVKAPKQMTPKQQEDFREAWVAKYGNGRGVSQVPLILTEGLDIAELSMSAVDAQLLESRKFQVIDIARAFGVPPFMIGEVEKTSSWGTGIDSMGIGFVKYTLQPYITRNRQELNRKTFPHIDRYSWDYDVRDLERADSTGRANYNKASLGGTQSPGWRTPNEVRAEDRLPPLPGGDKLYSPVPIAGAATDENEQTDANAGEAAPAKPKQPA